MELEPLIQQTQFILQPLFAKPKLTDKLLSKPPFRFLHDIVSAVTASTGFPGELFSEDELDSGNLQDKQAKMIYLDKLVNCLGHCKGTPIDVRSAKIVAGLEPENTNILLQALAEVASDPQRYNWTAAVQATLEGREVGTVRIAAEAKPSRARASEKESDFDKGGKDAANEFKSSIASREEPSSKTVPQTMDPAPGPQPGADYSDRGKSRGSTRGAARQTSDVGLSGTAAAPLPKNFDQYIDRCDGEVERTQELLGAVITKPKLTEKLLAKPPFRFIHDIVMEVINVTQFAQGLYNEVESDSSLVKERDAKIAFLEKIVQVVGIQLNTLIEARPAKIVAGLEPTDTNRFLQLLAVAATHAPDSRAAVRSVLEAGIGAQPNPGEPTEAPSIRASEVPARTTTRLSEPPAAREEAVEEVKPSAPTVPALKVAHEPISAAGANDADRGDDDLVSSLAAEKRSMRPATARRRPPKLKENVQEGLPKEEKKAAPVGIMLDGDDADEEEHHTGPEDDKRLADDVDVKLSSNDRHGKLVQDILKRQNEEEKAQAKTSDGKSEEQPPTDADTGIRLGRLKKTGDKGKATVATFDENDIRKIRSSVQVMVTAAAPLGKCMDYIPDDLGVMNAELTKWHELCKQYEKQLDERRRGTEDALQPLRAELMELDDQVRLQQQRVTSLKAVLSRNDDRIKQLMRVIISTT